MTPMWEPATDIEQRMRDALRAGQQEDYFRVLARMELLLPIAEETSPSPNGSGSWATWATEDRTHVLAFTSPEAMQACLRSHAGAFRTVRFAALSEAWPDSEWWLAVNPGTPIEGYLPAWFVQQVANGDVYLPDQQSAPQTDTGWGGGSADGYQPVEEDPRQQPPPYGQTSAVTPPSETGGLPRRSPSPSPDSGPPRREEESAFPSSYADSGFESAGSGSEFGGGSYQDSYGDSGLPRRDAGASYQDSYADSGSGFESTSSGFESAGDGMPRREPGATSDSFPTLGEESGMPRRDPGAGLGAFDDPPREDTYPGQAFNAATEGFRSADAGSGYRSGDTGYQPTVDAGYQSVSDTGTGYRTGDTGYQPTVDASYQSVSDTGFGASDGGYQSPSYPGQSFNAAQDSYQQPASYPGQSFNAAQDAPAPQQQPSSGGGELVPVSTGWPSEDAVEERLAFAAGNGNTQAFLEALLRAWAYLPVSDDCPPSARPGDPEFRWHTDLIDGAYTITAFTTATRLSNRHGGRPYIKTTFGRLTAEWPGIEYSLYVNPSTEVGANVPGPQVATLVAWARTQGLLDAALEMEAFNPPSAVRQPVSPEIMQKVLPHRQVDMTLDRGYDRVSGFVHRYVDVEEFVTPEQLYNALGLLREGTDFSPSDEAVHVVRWVGHRTDLYRVAYGGNDPESAQQNGGWIVEPPPFSGDGFAPSVGGRRITEYKIDSVRLPHGAQMFRVTAGGEVREIATYDSDRREWVRSGSGGDWESDPFRQEQQHA